MGLEYNILNNVDKFFHSNSNKINEVDSDQRDWKMNSEKLFQKQNKEFFKSLSNEANNGTFCNFIISVSTGCPKRRWPEIECWRESNLITFFCHILKKLNEIYRVSQEFSTGNQKITIFLKIVKHLSFRNSHKHRFSAESATLIFFEKEIKRTFFLRALSELRRRRGTMRPERTLK